MKRILLGSMPVGGGHNALRDSFLKTLKDSDPAGQSFELVSFTSEDPRVPGFYEVTVHHAPWLQRLVWDLSRVEWGNRLAVVTNRGLFQEVRRTLDRVRPDVVVSTHLLLSMMFARARHRFGLDFTLVNAIPDYGDPTLGFFPSAPDLRSDYAICMERGPYRVLVEKLGAPVSRIHLSGFNPRPPFMEVGRLVGDHQKVPAAERARIREELVPRHPRLAALDLEKPTLIFLGGSAWTEKTMPVIEQILRTGDFAQSINAIFVSGRNESFHQALGARVRDLERFFVFGFVTPEEMAALVALSDLPVLGSVAPASMHELMEARCGPLMLFHYIPGSEDTHGEWLRTHEVGLYEPDPVAMTTLLMEATGYKPARTEIARLLERFPQRAKAIREDHQARALELPAFMAHVGQVAPLHAPRPQAAGWEAESKERELRPTPRSG